MSGNRRRQVQEARRRRNATRWALLLGIWLLVPGCVTMGVLATTDPDKKLQDALYLMDDIGRPLMSEPLIREALAIYEQRGDQKGLGNAYRVYGIFLTSPSVTRWQGS